MKSTALSLSRLLQLASPTLPVGAYSYSQGLEWAIEQGWVRDEKTAGQWIGEVLELSLLQLEVPLLVSAMLAWREGRHADLRHLNELFFASRESAELYAETRQMGYSMLRLLEDLQLGDAAQRQLLLQEEEIAFPLVWALAAAQFDLAVDDAAHAYVWSWLENQVMGALKAVPLGQVSGQRLLLQLAERAAAALPHSLYLAPEHWNTLTPALAIASSCHETQYSRIFRS